jgi:hypothetical protein
MLLSRDPCAPSACERHATRADLDWKFEVRSRARALSKCPTIGNREQTNHHRKTSSPYTLATHFSLLSRCAINTQHNPRTLTTTTPTLGRAPFASACTAALPDLPSLQHLFHQRAHCDNVSPAEQRSAPTPRLRSITSTHT